jgi:hypothetical protein
MAMKLKQNSVYSHGRILCASFLPGLLAAGWMCTHPVSAGALQGPQSIEGGRPVEKAIALLARELGWNISYEDPPYVSPDDMRDETVVEINGERALVPRGGRVTLPKNVHEWANKDPIPLLESMLSTEETPRGKVKRFKILHSGTMFHVVPTRRLNEQGQWESVVPVLDTEVRLSPGERSLNEFLNQLCAEITTSSGTTVAAVIRPMHGLSVPLSQQWEGRARDLLAQALASLDTPRSWLLLYDIPRRMYFLHVVTPGTD